MAEALEAGGRGNRHGEEEGELHRVRAGEAAEHASGHGDPRPREPGQEGRDLCQPDDERVPRPERPRQPPVALPDPLGEPEEYRRHKERDPDAPRSAERGRDPPLAHQADQCCGNRRDDHCAEEAGRAATEHGPPQYAEEPEHGGERPEVEGGIKGKSLIAPAEERAHEHEMPRATHGEELGEPLHYAEDQRAKNIHKASVKRKAQSAKQLTRITRARSAPFTFRATPLCLPVLMDRSSTDQAVELLTRAQRGVLLLVPWDTTADAFAAMVALSLALEALGKPTTTVSPAHVPTLLQFLPGTAQVRDDIPHNPELVVHVPVGDHRPDQVRWEVVAQTLQITVRPPRGATFPRSEVTVRHGSYPWDCIVTLGTPRLHALGDVFASHPPFFYQTPVLNIDRGAANEFFGTVNLVPATVGTVSEVVADLLAALGGVNLLSREVATCLLTGITAGTHSFRAPWTTPHTFQIASLLVTQEADRPAIIRRLFHTHALTELRLLGRALTRMDELSPSALWSSLSAQDFTESAAAAELAPAIFQELLQWVGDRRAVLLALERQPGTLEVLVALGRISEDDREAFRASLQGVSVGPWVLVNLGGVSLSDTRQALAERILPQLPRSGRAPGED